MASRCRCPPENAAGYRLAAVAGRATCSSASRTRCAVSRAGRAPRARSDSARIADTVMAGLSELYGSWNTAWMSRARPRRARPRSRVMSRPPKLIRPPDTGARPRMARPSVVLPEPDSPTTPSVSPGAMARLTPDTAVTRCRRARYATVRSWTSSNGPVMAAPPAQQSARTGCAGRP